MFRNQSVDTHKFAMIPKADIPRSSFNIEKTHKTTFDAGYLVPVYLDEVLPGDTFNLRMTAFARMATPLFPIMDNMYLDSFFFFVPNRLVWDNWQRFMGDSATRAIRSRSQFPSASVQLVVMRWGVCKITWGSLPWVRLVVPILFRIPLCF